MTFVASAITVALVTTHLRRADVPRALTRDGVRHAIVQCASLLHRLGKRPPRVVVAALNPHAGEAGMFGDEERDVIEPAVRLARDELGRMGVQAIVTNPTGAETAFRVAFAGGFDGVVAMYHDQSTIPMKLMCFGEAVNVTAGLRIVRTSVDHGTAYDIAGTGRADPASMLVAIELADRLARS
jgi:4-hydroxythreonine-4-phosphate dehydrogenase